MNSDDRSSRASSPRGNDDLSSALEAAGARTQNAFEKLYCAAVPALIAWTRLRSAGLPPGRIDVDDVLQETWTRAFECFAQFDQGASFRHWIIGIAQNVLYETLRRDRRGRERDDTRILSQCPDSVTSISRAAARDESFSRLLELVFELPEDDRQLVLMHGLEERPLASVARRLEISEDAAAKRWQRLCARLRAQPAFVSVLQV